LTKQSQVATIDAMGPTAILAFVATPLFTKVGVALNLTGAPFHRCMASFMSCFALQLDDLDSGLGNELWFLAVIVVVAGAIYYVYRGPRET